MSSATFVIFVVLQLTIVFTDADYWQEREDFIKLEENRMLGSSIVLNAKEQIVNSILMSHKLREYDLGFENPDTFSPGRHFFDSKKAIEESEVFKFIQKLPKGAALHGHDTALASEESLYSLTYKDNLHACTVGERLKLRFMLNPQEDKTCNWTLISTLRKQDSTYDNWMRAQLTLLVENPREKYNNSNVVWKAFEEVFETVDPMLYFRPVFQENLYQALKELYDDNVMYLEIRGSLASLYELNGTTYSPMETAALYKETIEKFKKNHPGFLGARYIYSPYRKVNNETLDSYVEIVKEFKRVHPDFLAGFDLIGQEDLGLSLSEFVHHLKEISSNGIDFFFHAGETNWHGSSTDFNMVDAVLLGTKRIGHGYALIKHPLVMELVKKRQIGIEVCPISNQILMLVEDMRNHPAAPLIAQGFPIVISYDDPTFWSTKGLSYDFYMAFMGMASRNADLKLLKQLAKNSLIYSALPAEDKMLAVKAWEKQWDKFLGQILREHHYEIVV